MAGTSVMKLRSCLLFACMAIVPLVAMFSHKIPRDWRLAAQRLARGEAPIPPTPQPPAPVPPAAEPVAATPPQQRPDTPALPPPTPVAGPADTARSRLMIEDQLRALGAVSIECVPMMQGTSHRCSCRVPADPSGQLQRVFQSSNPDPIVALKNLHGQVQFWKHRLAMRPDVANPLRTSGDGGQTGLR